MLKVLKVSEWCKSKWTELYLNTFGRTRVVLIIIKEKRTCFLMLFPTHKENVFRSRGQPSDIWRGCEHLSFHHKWGFTQANVTYFSPHSQNARVTLCIPGCSSLMWKKMLNVIFGFELQTSFKRLHWHGNILKDKTALRWQQIHNAARGSGCE